jgi:flagellar basal-body rod protein FlgB
MHSPLMERRQMMSSTFVRTDAFDYINVLDKAADASWERNTLISNNIANADTPNYKREDIDFESTLQRELGNSKYTTMDSKVHNARSSKLNAQPYEDATSYSYRLDGNNVDPETENVELASNQLKYQGLTESISQEFKNLQSVLKT